MTTFFFFFFFQREANFPAKLQEVDVKDHAGNDSLLTLNSQIVQLMKLRSLSVPAISQIAPIFASRLHM